MKPLLNASEVWEAIPAGCLRKRGPSKKHPKNKLNLRKISFIVKPGGQNYFMVKLRLKHKLLSYVSTIRKLTWKTQNVKLKNC